jgi:chromosomal replication initiator protein
VPNDLDRSWEQIQLALRESVGERTFGLWLAPLRCVGLDGDTLILSGPPEISTWAAARLGPALRTATAAVLGPGIDVSIGPETGPGRTRPSGDRALAEPRPTDQLNPKYTFEQFVIGESNRLAHAAALSVAEMPTQAYNPLFIYGPPGLGKTHLLHSIGNYIRAFGGGLSVRYATAEDFTNAFVAALGARDMERFKSRFRAVDVLLIDDVQFLERTTRSEEEFFHTFNALHDSGSQLVLSSDRLPGDLGRIETRLRERFGSGLVTDIERPDHATRLAILRKRAAFDGLAVGDDVLDLVAARVTSNVRALEGALIRLVALASLTGEELNGAVASKALDRLGVALTANGTITISRIQHVTCEHFALSADELLSRSRAERVSWPRHVAMYLSRELTSHSLPQIGRAFGDRDHTTVLHACRRVTEQIATDPAAFAHIELLTTALAADG